MTEYTNHETCHIWISGVWAYQMATGLALFETDFFGADTKLEWLKIEPWQNDTTFAPAISQQTDRQMFWRNLHFDNKTKRYKIWTAGNVTGVKWNRAAESPIEIERYKIDVAVS